MSIPRFTLLGSKLPREAITPALGKLEQRVMEEVWRIGETSVRDIQRALGDQEAYTTIMTTLDRLYKKGLLRRRKESRAFLYTPCVSRDEFHQRVVRDVMDALMGATGGSVGPVLTSFVETVSARDRELLDELERLVQDKKREMQSKE